MTTATAHIPSGHASFWEDARWWVEQTINVYGEPAEFDGRFERRSVADRLRGWLSEIECLVRRLVIAAALALDLPPPAPAKPRAGADSKPAPSAERKPEKSRPPPRLSFLPAVRKDGASSDGSGAPRPFDWDAAYARYLSDRSHSLKPAGDLGYGMIDFRADLTDPLDRPRRTPDDAHATDSRTRFDIASYALYLRDAQPQSAQVSIEKYGRKLEALMYVLADPPRAILQVARRLAARPHAVEALSDRLATGVKPQILKDTLRDTIGLIGQAMHAWGRSRLETSLEIRPAPPCTKPACPDPYEEPG